MKVSPRDLAAKMRAFSVGDLLAAYKRGRRNFERSNLLRVELETILKDENWLDCLDHPDTGRYNALWVDYRTPAERDFEWDRYGHILFAEDLLGARDLKSARLPGINLSGSYLYPVDFSGGDLSRADLRRAIFIDCKLAGANLRRADLRDATFEACDIRDVDFYMARMERVRFNDCNVIKSVLRRAKLNRARLRGVNLQKAVLDDAHCDRVVLGDVDLRSVDLSRVRFPGARVGRVVISRNQVGSLLRALGVEIKTVTP